MRTMSSTTAMPALLAIAAAPASPPVGTASYGSIDFVRVPGLQEAGNGNRGQRSSRLRVLSRLWKRRRRRGGCRHARYAAWPLWPRARYPRVRPQVERSARRPALALCIGSRGTAAHPIDSYSGSGCSTSRHRRQRPGRCAETWVLRLRVQWYAQRSDVIRASTLEICQYQYIDDAARIVSYVPFRSVPFRSVPFLPILSIGIVPTQPLRSGGIACRFRWSGKRAVRVDATCPAREPVSSVRFARPRGRVRPCFSPPSCWPPPRPTRSSRARSPPPTIRTAVKATRQPHGWD